MNPQTIAHLSNKYAIRPSIIVRLHNLSVTWQNATTERFRTMTRRQYDMIVTRECGGVDPLI